MYLSFKTIDFNNLSSSSYQSEVTIHKRSRRSDENSPDSFADSSSALDTSGTLKKRKFRIVPNNPPATIVNQTQMKTVVKTEEPDSSAADSDVVMVVPENRQELLQLVCLFTCLLIKLCFDNFTVNVTISAEEST